MQNILYIKDSINKKIEAERAQKNKVDTEVLKHLQDFIELKKVAPKNPNELSKLTGEIKIDYYGNTHRVYSGFFKRFITTYKYYNLETVKIWRRDCLDSGKKASTFNLELTMLKGFSTYLVDIGFLKRKIINKQYKYLKTNDQKNYKVLSDKDIDYLLDCNYKDKVVAYIKFGLRTGLRASELVNIPNFKYIESDRTLVVVGKGGAVRRIRLGLELRQLRERIISRPIKTTSYLGKRLRAFKKLKNLDNDISFHCFRATYATKLYESGQPIELVAKVLGHKSIDTTQKYIDSLRAAKPSELVNPYKEIKT